MSDLKKYIEKRKASSPAFAEGFEEGYENFRIGVLLKQARLEAGLTQEEVTPLRALFVRASRGTAPSSILVPQS